LTGMSCIAVRPLTQSKRQESISLIPMNVWLKRNLSRNLKEVKTDGLNCKRANGY
jgi:predicted HAD superfamily phosphohydrolase YqeG